MSRIYYISYKFDLKFIKFLFALIVSFDSMNCFSNEYRIGYIEGFRDSRRGLSNRFIRSKYRNPQRYHRFNEHNYRFGPHMQSDYDYDSSDSSDAQNYDNLFGVDELEFRNKMNKMSNTCRHNVKPYLRNCIERAANKWDVNINSDKLGANDCKALWDLMCCSIKSTVKECTSQDIQVLQNGFISIQESLEVKECRITPRTTVPCLLPNI